MHEVSENHKGEGKMVIILNNVTFFLRRIRLERNEELSMRRRQRYIFRIWYLQLINQLLGAYLLLYPHQRLKYPNVFSRVAFRSCDHVGDRAAIAAVITTICLRLIR